MPEALSDLAGLRGMMVLFEKQVHLQKEVGAVSRALVSVPKDAISPTRSGTEPCTYWMLPLMG